MNKRIKKKKKKNRYNNVLILDSFLYDFAFSMREVSRLMRKYNEKGKEDNE